MSQPQGDVPDESHSERMCESDRELSDVSEDESSTLGNDTDLFRDVAGEDLDIPDAALQYQNNLYFKSPLQSLPCPEGDPISAAAEGNKKRSSKMDETETMKIAWRYQHLPKHQVIC